MQTQLRSCLFSSILASLFLSCAPQFNIRTGPIQFSQNRVAMTLEYIGRHYHIRTDDIRIRPYIIVLHWTGLESAALSFKALDRETYNSGSELNVSAHYLVDKDGSIIQLMSDNWMANHVFGLNYFAIGIENVGGSNGKDDLSIQQVEANAALIRYLVRKYPRIQYLIGHHEYFCFYDHPLFIERTMRKPPGKIDPGAKFMRQVRARISDLGLRGPQEIEKETIESKQQQKMPIRFDKK